MLIVIEAAASGSQQLQGGDLKKPALNPVGVDAVHSCATGAESSTMGPQDESEGPSRWHEPRSRKEPCGIRTAAGNGASAGKLLDNDGA